MLSSLRHEQPWHGRRGSDPLSGKGGAIALPPVCRSDRNDDLARLIMPSGHQGIYTSLTDVTAQSRDSEADLQARSMGRSLQIV
nr:hypothetical protein REQ54_04704 [Rhizobium sp. Q54]